MARGSRVAGVEFGFPLIEQRERGGSVGDLVAEIVRDAAVGVDVDKVLAQAARQKPRGDGEIFVVGAGQAGAVLLRFGQGRRGRGDGVGGGKTAPAEGCGRCGRRDLRRGLSHGLQTIVDCRLLLENPNRVELLVFNQQSKINNWTQWPGMMAVLMSPPRFSMWRRTCCKRESGASPVM